MDSKHNDVIYSTESMELPAHERVAFPELDAFLPVNPGFSGVIFDFDGTLVDSMGVWYEVDRRFCEKYGFDLPNDYVQDIAALGFEETARYFHKYSKGTMTVDEIGKKFIELAIDEYSTSVKCVAGAVKYLGILKERGVGVAIATSISKELLHACMQANELTHLFDTVAFCDECGSNKHSSDVYELAARRIGCYPDECLVFEDVAVAIQSAKRIGMTVGAIADPYSIRDSDLVRDVADFYIHSFEPLVNQLI